MELRIRDFMLNKQNYVKPWRLHTLSLQQLSDT